MNPSTQMLIVIVLVFGMWGLAVLGYIRHWGKSRPVVVKDGIWFKIRAKTVAIDVVLIQVLKVDGDRVHFITVDEYRQYRTCRGKTCRGNMDVARFVVEYSPVPYEVTPRK